MATVLLYIAIVICWMGSGTTGTLQQVTFYQGPGCTGQQLGSATDTRDDVESKTAANAFSMKVIGVWKIVARRKVSEDTWSKFSITPDARPPNGECVDRMDWSVEDPIEYKIAYVERMGAADINGTSQVILSTEANFDGLRWIKDSDSNIQQSAMMSYVRFGSDVWTTYPEPNYAGQPSYIRPSGRPVDPKDDFSFSRNTILVVGSVRKGQYGGDPPTTDGPTETSTETCEWTCSPAGNGGAYTIPLTTFNIFTLTSLLMIIL